VAQKQIKKTADSVMMIYPDDYGRRRLQPRGHHGQVHWSGRELLEGCFQAETQASTEQWQYQLILSSPTAKHLCNSSFNYWQNKYFLQTFSLHMACCYA